MSEAARFDNARKKFRFQVAPSNRQLWAIGMVAVQWSAVETLVTILAHGLTQEDKAARDKFNSTYSFGPRIDLLEAIVEANVMQPWRKTLLEHINEIRLVQDLRDKIIHGTWGDDGGNPFGKDATGISNFGKPHAPFKWKLDYGGILAVALRVDKLQHAIYEFLRNGQIPDNLILSDTLQHILRKRDRSSSGPLQPPSAPATEQTP